MRYTRNLKFYLGLCALAVATGATPAFSAETGGHMSFAQVVAKGLGRTEASLGSPAYKPVMASANTASFIPDLQSQSYFTETPNARGQDIGMEAVTTTLELRQPLYRSGHSRAQAQASDSRQRAAEAAVQLEEQRAALSIIDTYLHIQRDADQAALMQQMKMSYDSIETKRQAQAAARQQLHSLTGIGTGVELSRINAAPALPASLQAALETAEKKNPALRKAHYECMVAEAADRSVAWEQEPDIDLRGGLDRTVDRFSDDLSNESGIIGLQATIPLLGSETRKSLTVQAREDAQSGRLKIDSTRLQVRQDVIKAWDDITRAKAEVTFQQHKARLATAGAEGQLPRSSAMARHGDAGAFKTLAQQARLDGIAAETELLKAQYRLLAATGQLMDSLHATRNLAAQRDINLMRDFQNTEGASGTQAALDVSAFETP